MAMAGYIGIPQLETKEKKFTVKTITNSPVLWPLVLLFEVLIYSSYGILINLSTSNGHVPFESSSLTLSIEFLKMFMSLLMTWPDISSGGVPSFRVTHVLPFCVPALCYCFNNNISVFMQEEMDPATFQVLCNLKIVSTALIYKILIKRRLSQNQWFSLILLTFAGGLNGYFGLSAKTRSLQEIHVTLNGLAMTVLYCLISGFAGVFTEYILKKNNEIPLAFQNCYLYIFGIALNFFMWLIQSGGAVNLFQGFNGFTWAAVMSQALNGLMMSMIMKYSSNIIRLFVIASAVPVATVLSMFFFNLEPGYTFVIVIILVMLAIYLYNV